MWPRLRLPVALRRQRTWTTALFLLAYCAAVAAGRATRLEGTQLALVWPAAAVAYLWLHWSWARGRPELDLPLLAVATAGANVATGASAGLAAAFAVSHAAQAAVAVLAVRRFAPHGWRLRTVTDLSVLVGAVVVASALSSLVATLALWATQGLPVLSTAGAWTLRNSTGAFVFAALAVRLWDRHPSPAATCSRFETAGTAVLLAAFYCLVFVPDEPLPLAFTVLPLTIWVALRSSTTVATANVLFTGAFVVAATAAGRGPFSAHAPSSRVFLAQAFVATIGLVTLSLALQRDERAQLLAERQESVQDLQAWFDAGMAAMLELDEQGRVARANPAAHRLLSLPPGALLLRELLQLVHEDDRATASALLHEPGGRQVEVRLARTDGSEPWCALTVSELRRGGGPLVQLLDVTERRHAEARLQDAALRDPLTGLSNRTVLERRLAELQEQPPSSRVVLAYLDLDGFKPVNDRYGHDAGDAVLRACAARLRGLVRAGDDVVRLGGDEFVLLCPVPPMADAERLAAELARHAEVALAAPVEHAGGVLRVGASVGTLVAAGGGDAASTLGAADRAMYERKRARRRAGLVRLPGGTAEPLPVGPDPRPAA